MTTTTVKMKTVKLKNRRVSLGELPNGGFAMQFKRLEGREVVTTDLNLSKEAMEALCLMHSSYANSEFALMGFLATAFREAELGMRLGVVKADGLNS